MGAAMASGLMRDGDRLWDLTLSNTTGTLPAALQAYALPCTRSNAEAVCGADVMILAVLPQQYPQVLGEIRDAARPGACLISIAPGYTLEKLNSLTDGRFQIVRAMPNMPALVGEGITGYCPNGKVTDAQLALAVSVIKAFSEAEAVPETLMSVVTSVSGSSPFL